MGVDGPGGGTAFIAAGSESNRRAGDRGALRDVDFLEMQADLLRFRVGSTGCDRISNRDIGTLLGGVGAVHTVKVAAVVVVVQEKRQSVP